MHYDSAAFEYTGPGTALPMTIRNGHPHVDAAIELTDGTWASGDFVIDVGSSLPLSLTKRFADSHRAVLELLAHK